MGSAYRLGLDLGANSIGWCAVELDEDGRAIGVLDAGARIFSDGRNPKDGTSLAAMRRGPRSMRRRRDRYLKRRTRLMDTLVHLGLMPDDEGERKKLERRDPYELRAKALDQPLHPHELGRALFHLNQRRGFQSNRKTDKLADNERSQLKAAINTLHQRVEQSGARTLGEYLHRRHRKGKPIRAKPELDIYPDRSLYEREFEAIRAEQHACQALTPADWETLADIIFFQRALRPVDPGKCTLEPDKQRAPWALPEAQRFRILQEINNLRVEPFGAPARHLSQEERDTLLSKLQSQKEVRFDKLAKLLGLPSETHFNLWDEKRSALKGDQTAARLSNAKLFGKRWHSLRHSEQTRIVRDLLEQEDRNALLRRAVEEWGLDADAADRVVDTTLPPGYARFCEAAIGKLVPIMRDQGLVLADAVAECHDYAHHSDFRPTERLDRLPYYGAVLQRHVVGGDPNADTEVERYGRIANPTVHIGLNQLRRVVNRLIDVYGHPQEVVIELARELKQSADDRTRVQREQRQNQEANQRRASDIEAAGFVPSGELIRKLRLWEEQGPPQARHCPFTGEQISFAMAISDETEVEHILPFSRTLDDSMANKVLCLRRANRDKGHRAPVEAFGDSPKGYDYDAILARAEKLPGNKRWRFQPDAMDRYEKQRDFLDRHLNETKYLSRIASQYAAHVTPKVRVVPGTLTGLLRGKWGLNGLLSDSNQKVRTDHRHHAIDAFVVAMTTQGMLKAVADAAARSSAERDRLIADMPPPWDGFTPDELRSVTDQIVVSHKPDHGTPGAWQQTTGALHNDTAYGIERERAPGKYDVVHRVPLDTIKKRDDLERVKDKALRQRLMDLWDHTVGIGQRVRDFAVAARNEFGVKSVRVTEVVSGVAIKDERQQPYKVYKTDGNAFMDVYRPADGRWRAETVSRFLANQPNAEPNWKRQYPAAKKIARLHVDDLVALGNGNGRRVYRVVKLSGSNAVLAEHHEAGSLKARDADQNDLFQYVYASPSRLQREGFRRLGVDELGRVRDPGPGQ